MAADIKEVLQCFVLAYIQKYPYKSHNDFVCYYSGLELNQNIQTRHRRYNKGTLISPEMLLYINKYNTWVVENNRTNKKETPLNIIDETVFTQKMNFDPLAGLTNDLEVNTIQGVIDELIPFLRVQPKGKTLLQFVTKPVSTRIKKEPSTEPVTDWIQKMHTCVISGKALYTSLLRGGGYTFLTQDAAFTKLVKNEALGRIRDAMDKQNVLSNIDILSSVDFYIVKKTRMKKIETFIKDHILGKGKTDIDILDNMRLDSPNSYHNFMKKEFLDGNCFGVSAKLDTNRNIPRTFKVIGDVTRGSHTSGLLAEEMKKHLDIFTKVMIYLAKNPNKKVEEVLNQLIKFDDFDIRPTQANWSVKVFFDMSIISPTEKNKYVFSFEALGDAGYNGHPLVRRDPKEPNSKLITAPYTGGISGEAVLAKLFFVDYKNEFRDADFIERRTAGATDFKDFLKQEKFLKAKDVVTEMKRMKLKDTDIEEYLAEATVRLMSERFLPDESESCYTQPMTNKLKNYGKAQHFYFLSNKAIQEKIKKRIFFTIYGLITKSGYRIFTETETKAFIQKEYKAIVKKIPNTKVTAEFQTVPHLMLGSLAPY